ncbi:hypothetical protein CYLTODRAFT_420018 [Cylindrobasidium torrendii FP15055 ss-10]|uniref:HMG box domain-containing protein n=1 Tax=Cylindrobasidium torrendii FP15055 ss-10 TaxID=1314674 RepID=A0A0D7BI53_9AGAR|nr:hypothetical protein CYLTODRAFT_420018 [Cylindrobasidium torrendii FP15055 ss-10]
MAKSTTTSTSTHIPRPPNKWILFRCDFTSRGGSPTEAQAAWKALTHEEKSHWQRLAALEADEHAQRHPGYRYSPNKERKSTKAKKETKSTNVVDSALVHLVHLNPITERDRSRRRDHKGHTSASAPYARPPTRSRASTSTSSPSSSFDSSPLPSIPSLYIDPGLLSSPSSSSSVDIDWTQYASQSQSRPDFSASHGYSALSFPSSVHFGADFVSESFDAANTDPVSAFDYSPSAFTSIPLDSELYSTAEQPLYSGLDSGYPSFGVDLSFGMYPSWSYGDTTFDNVLGLSSTFPSPDSWSNAGFYDLPF